MVCLIILTHVFVIDKILNTYISIKSSSLKFCFAFFPIISLLIFIVSFLSFKFGDLFSQFMEKHGSKWFTIIGVLIVLIGILIYLISKLYV